MEYTRSLYRLDRYLGTFICYIFSFIAWFRPKKKVKSIKNVLIIELFEMAAAVMAYPSLRYMDDKNVYVLCLKEGLDSWGLFLPKENIHIIDNKNLFRFGLSLLKQIFRLRKNKIDMIIDYELFTRISSMIAFMVKSKLRAGFHKYSMEGLFRGNYYDYKCVYNQHYHISKNLLALTKVAINQIIDVPSLKNHVFDTEIIVPDIKVKTSIFDRVGTFKKYVLICPDGGNALPVRNYPLERFVDIIKGLHEYKVILIGTKSNWDNCEWVSARTGALNLAGKTSLTELIELMANSELVITNDGGPAHFASLTQTRILVLFGAETPYIYGPLGKCVALYTHFQCSPCVTAFNHKNTPCNDNRCIKVLSAEYVLYMAKLVLADKLLYRTVNGNGKYV